MFNYFAKLFAGKSIVQNRLKLILIPLIIIFLGFASMLIYHLAGLDAVNLTPEFGGGYELTLNMGSALDDDGYDETLSGIKEILRENGVTVYSVQNTEKDFIDQKGIIIVYKNIPGKNMDGINTQITEALNVKYENTVVRENFVKISVISKSISDSGIILTTLALVCALIIIAFFMGIRFDWACALAYFIAVLMDIFLMLGLLILFHVPVGGNILVALYFLIVFSALNNLFVFNNLRVNKKAAYDAKNFINDEVADKSIERSGDLIITYSIFGAVIFLALSLFGAFSVFTFAFPILLGIIASVYTSLFAGPAIWSSVYAERKVRMENKQKRVQIKAQKRAKKNAQKKYR